MRLFLILLSVLIIFSSCQEQKDKTVYTAYHGLALNQLKGDQIQFQTYLNWGVAMVETGREWTNLIVSTNRTRMITNQVTVFCEVDVSELNLKGFVSRSGIIENVSGLGVIYDPEVMVRDVPALDSPGRQNVSIPVLVYITNSMKNQSGDWDLVSIYNTPEFCRMPYTDYARMNNTYVDPTGISTNRSDVEIVKAVQLATREYLVLTNSFNTSTNELYVRQEEYTRKLNLELENLDQIVTRYAGASLPVMEYLSNFYQAVIPSESAETPGEVEGMTNDEQDTNEIADPEELDVL